MSTSATSEPRRRGGLFTRIVLTFAATALASALVAGVAGYTFATRVSAAWVADVTEALDRHGDDLQAVADDDAQLAAVLEAIAEEVDGQVGLYDRRGRKLAGQGPPHLPRGMRRHRKELRRRNPVVFRRNRLQPPGVLYGVIETETGRLARVVGVMPQRGIRLSVPFLSLALMLPVLGAGAFVLSRSLTRRLGRLEASAGRIARGELRHRVTLDAPTPRDELDQLGQAFNEMAEKVETLLQGQRTLLANVSHELRTPIARMKVLIEILQERVLTLRERGEQSRPVQRLDKGLADLALDVEEVQTLISDLLTSGRLELRHGAGAGLQTHRVDVEPLLQRVAARVDAEVELAGAPTLVADELLVERLLSNLLANARRACPDGTITLGAQPHGDGLELTVEDQGPGVDPDHRETIFEPFTRLDEARDRDRGGVGLGLYLCRQICRSHGGTITVTERRDGAGGARFVVRLPGTPT